MKSEHWQIFWEFGIGWWQTWVTVVILAFYLHLFLCFFTSSSRPHSTNILSSVPHRRQNQFCLLWCFWHPTRGDWRGCEGCRWDFHGDGSIRRRYKQHNPSLWSGMYTWMNSNRNSTSAVSEPLLPRRGFPRALLRHLWWQWWCLCCCFPDVQMWGCTVTTSSEPPQTVAQSLPKVAVLLWGAMLASLCF